MFVRSNGNPTSSVVVLTSALLALRAAAENTEAIRELGLEIHTVRCRGSHNDKPQICQLLILGNGKCGKVVQPCNHAREIVVRHQ